MRPEMNEGRKIRMRTETKTERKILRVSAKGQYIYLRKGKFKGCNIYLKYDELVKIHIWQIPYERNMKENQILLIHINAF